MIRTKVETILKYYPEARNSDKELFRRFMEAHDLYLTHEQLEILRRMPSLESARRERQKFQEKGLYPADKTVKQTRNRMEQEIGQRIPTTRPEQIQTLFDIKPRYFG